MLIDRYLPTYDVTEICETNLRARRPGHTQGSGRRTSRIVSCPRSSLCASSHSGSSANGAESIPAYETYERVVAVGIDRGPGAVEIQAGAESPAAPQSDANEGG